MTTPQFPLLFVILFGLSINAVADELPNEYALPSAATYDADVTTRIIGRAGDENVQMNLAIGCAFETTLKPGAISSDSMTIHGTLHNVQNTGPRNPVNPAAGDTTIAITSLEGAQFVAVLNRSGRCDDIRLSDSTLRGRVTNPAQLDRDGRALLTVVSLIKEAMFFPLPNTSGKPGKEWSLERADTTVSEIGNIVTNSTRVMRYTRAIDSAGFKLAEIQFTAENPTVNLTGGMMSMFSSMMKMDKLDVRNSGSVLIDRDGGAVVAASSTNTVRMVMSTRQEENTSPIGSGKDVFDFETITTYAIRRK